VLPAVLRYFRRAGVAAIAVAAIVGPVRVSRAQGIDCFKAPNAVQRTICTDSDLIGLDAKMASLYRDAVKHATPAQQQVLATQQQRWATGTRDACGQQKDVKGCVTDAYTARNAQLTSFASGEAKFPATEAASTGPRASAAHSAPPAMPPLAPSAHSPPSTSTSPSTSAAKKKAPTAPKIATTGTHVYTCSDRSSLKVTYTKKGGARVQHGSSDWTLPHVRSASGARYKSGVTSVWNKGAELLFEHDGKKLTCGE
jgi:uncharacterized protein/membrane-bound inhibitor of C-type lysozyme